MRSRTVTGALALGLVVSTAGTLGLTTAAGAAKDDRRAEPAAQTTKAAKKALAVAEDVLSGDAKESTLDATMALRELWAAKDALRGADARAARTLLSRPTTEPEANPYDRYYGDGVPVESACSADLCLHWTEAENENGDAATPEYAAETLATLQRVHDTYVAAGYRSTLPDEGQEGNTKPDIYLSNIGGLGVYGYCTSDADDYTDGFALYAYCVLDNDYSPTEFGDANTPIENMQVTAAHEYFHAVQYAYDSMDDGWIYEATATWAEDEVFDDVNDNWFYLPYGQLGDPASTGYPLAGPGTSLDLFGFNSYGNWIFFRYLTERFAAAQGTMPTLVRDIWRELDTTGGRADTYSLQAVSDVLADRGTTTETQYAQFALENNTPAQTYEEGAAYPTPAYAFEPVTLSSRKPVSRTVTLDHLTSGTGAFVPSVKGDRLRVAVDMTDTRTGSMAAVAVHDKDGGVDRSWIRLNKKGKGSEQVPFASDTVAFVEVTLVNASTEMGACGTDELWSYSCGGFGTHDDQEQKVTVKVVG